MPSVSFVLKCVENGAFFSRSPISKAQLRGKQSAASRQWAEWDLTRTAFPMILMEISSMGVLSHEEFTYSE